MALVQNKSVKALSILGVYVGDTPVGWFVIELECPKIEIQELFLE